MNDIQQIVDNFLLAAERLERLTVQINVMSDQLEPALRGAGQVKSPEPLPYHGEGQAAPLNWQPTPPEMIAARDAAVAELAEQAQVPQAVMAPTAPQGASPSSPAVPPASAVEVEGPGGGSPETPRPAAPIPEAPPWVTQTETTEAAPAKRGGRRTNEELAAELGVDLDAVKKWKGGGRVSKADMEEFKRLHPETTAAIHPQAVADDFAPEPTAQQWAPAPDGAGAQVAAAQEWPAVAQPVTPPPAAEQFGDWPTVEGSFNPSNPFGG